MPEPWICPTCQQHWDQAEIKDGFCPACALGGFLVERRQYSGAGWLKAWAPPPVAELQPLFADYTLLGLVGRGGMGAVYKAVQKKLDRVVAIKILPPELGWNPALQERFLREAQTLAKLNHPGIVTIHDSGASQDLYYLVMEYVDGPNLREYLADNPLSPRQALELGIRFCRTMEAAHAAGIVHRDLKPENILVPSLEQAKIADFGVAKVFGGTPADDRAAVAATALGSGCFMAPEQRNCPAEVDFRADIYSLGVILYWLVTGVHPEPEPVPPSQALAGLGTHCDRVVMRAVSGDPARRFQSMEEMRLELESVLDSEGRAEAEALARENARRQRWHLRLAILGVSLAGLAGLALLFSSMARREKGMASGTLPPPGQAFELWLDGKTPLAMKPVPAGAFEMGSPADSGPEWDPGERLHTVQISKSFWMGECEVTQAQYQNLTGSNPSLVQDPSRPVEFVSWLDAVRFCAILTEQEQRNGRLPLGYAYRLPTEAEWEWAAKAGKAAPAVGQDEAWGAANSGGKSHPVRQKAANALGLCDLYGNVSELCLDSWNSEPGLVTDKLDPVWRPGRDVLGKVIRGGSYKSAFFRSGYRLKTGSAVQSPLVGFRVVLAPEIKAALPVSAVSSFPTLGGEPPEGGKPFALSLPQKTALEMLPIPAGEFSSSRGGKVKISTAFWMGRTEVTQAQYEAVMAVNPSLFYGGGPNFPVENISCAAAMAFCRKLTARERAAARLPKGMEYRLPSMAEWMYACRANDRHGAAGTLEREEMKRVGWCLFNSDAQPHPVGEKPPNAWGLQDMFGNVAEWGLDRRTQGAPSVPMADGQAGGLFAESSRQPLLGGWFKAAFFNAEESGRSRFWNHDEMSGFRVVLAPAWDEKDGSLPDDPKGAKELAALPVDVNGVRYLPLTPKWWGTGTVFKMTPEGIFAENRNEKVDMSVIYILNLARKTEITLVWKLTDVDPAEKAPQLKLELALNALNPRLLARGQMALAPAGDGLFPVVPETWYRSRLQVLPSGDGGKVVHALSLAAAAEGEAKELYRWEYAIDEVTALYLHQSQLKFQGSGPAKAVLVCSKAEIRLDSGPAETARLPPAP